MLYFKVIQHSIILSGRQQRQGNYTIVVCVTDKTGFKATYSETVFLLFESITGKWH